MTPDEVYALAAPAVAAHIEESEVTLFLVSRPDGSLAYSNQGARKVLGIRSEPSSPELWDLLIEAEKPRMRALVAKGIDGVEARSINFGGGAQECETFDCRLWISEGYLMILGERSESESLVLRRRLVEMNNELIVSSRELTRRTRELEDARTKLQNAFDELETSYWHLRKIQEVLPICMECRKVKTSEAGWEDVVDYLQENALFLSHGYCPDCAQKMMERYMLTEEDEDAEESA